MGTHHTPQQHRRLSFSPSPSAGHDPTSFFNALGSGVLTRLHTLDIGHSYAAQAGMLGDANLLPNSLLSFRKLYIGASMPAGLLGGIFAAAGPGLTAINIDNGQTVPTAMRLLEENDYVWAPALQSPSLYWKGVYGGDGTQLVDPDTPLHAVDALARLPALNSLVVNAIEPDELLVRLLALAEGGGLPSLATVNLQNWRSVLTEGALLLLLLWLKREAKKALRGEG